MVDWRSHLEAHSSWVYAGLICAVFAAAFATAFDAKVDLNGDNAKYYLLAQSIADGKGYVKVFAPGEPPTSLYPPGYPFLMSGLMLFTDSVVAQKILNGLFLLGAALVLFLLLKAVTNDERFSALMAGFAVINYHLLKFSTIMMSEASFLLVSLLALYALVRRREDCAPWRDPRFYAFVGALSFAFHIRTQGISLLAGVLFHFLCTRRWAELATTLGGFVLLALPWRLRNQWQGLGSSRYLDQLLQANPWRPEAGEVGITGLLGRFAEQGTMVVTQAIPDSLFNFVVVDYQAAPSGALWGLGVAVLGVLLYGFWQMGRYRYLFLGYFLAVFGIVALWSATVDNRYLVTFIPLLQAGFFYGAYSLGRTALDRWGPSIAPSLVLPIALVIVGGFMVPRIGVLQAQASRAYPAGFYNYFQSANELGRTRNCQNTLVACRKPALFYLFSNCSATRYKFTTEPEALIRHLVKNDVNHVVLDQLGYGSTARYLYPAIREYADLFRSVLRKTEPDTFVLEFRRAEARRVLGRAPADSTSGRN
jgi:hypothetical protein